MKKTIALLATLGIIGSPSLDTIINRTSENITPVTVIEAILSADEAHAYQKKEFLRYKMPWDGEILAFKGLLPGFDKGNGESFFLVNYEKLKKDVKNNPEIIKSFPNLQSFLPILYDSSYRDGICEGPNEEILNLGVAKIKNPSKRDYLILFGASQNPFEPGYPNGPKEFERYFGHEVGAARMYKLLLSRETAFLGKYKERNPSHPNIDF